MVIRGVSVSGCGLFVCHLKTKISRLIIHTFHSMHSITYFCSPHLSSFCPDDGTCIGTETLVIKFFFRLVKSF